MSLIYNAQFDKNTRKLSFEDKAGNEIYSFTVPERTPAVDDVTKPLTFKATQDGSTVTLTKNNSPDGAFQTSTDGGSTWADYTLNTVITLNTGGKVSFRAKSDRTSGQRHLDYFYFEMTGKIEAWHNVMSLYRTNDFATYESVMDYAFSHLFQNCTSLTKAPVLPATTLADSCYWNMFCRCESLTKTPELPEATLARECYYGMFYQCYSLNEVHCKIPSSYSSSDISSYANMWLRNVSPTGTFYTNADANWPSGTSGIPEGWTRVNEVAKDDITKPLTFRATQDGSTVALKQYVSSSGSPSGDFQTSTDGGSTWTDYTINDVITLNTGDEVSFRAKADRTSEQTVHNYFYFVMTGKIEAWHNVMSLYSVTVPSQKPALSCAFYSIFKDCTSLTKAPALPATRLEVSCYDHMFYGCQSLTKAPALPATTLTYYCYDSMFYGCQSLKEVRISATKNQSFALNNWLKDVSATGDFYCDPNATIFQSGVSGIPQNWTRHAIADYPNP